MVRVAVEAVCLTTSVLCNAMAAEAPLAAPVLVLSRLAPLALGLTLNELLAPSFEANYDLNVFYSVLTYLSKHFGRRFNDYTDKFNEF